MNRKEKIQLIIWGGFGLIPAFCLMLFMMWIGVFSTMGWGDFLSLVFNSPSYLLISVVGSGTASFLSSYVLIVQERERKLLEEVIT